MLPNQVAIVQFILLMYKADFFLELCRTVYTVKNEITLVTYQGFLTSEFFLELLYQRDSFVTLFWNPLCMFHPSRSTVSS